MTNIWGLTKEISRPKLIILIKSLILSALYLLVMTVLVKLNLLKNMSKDDILGLLVAFPAILGGLVVPVMLAVNQESNWIKNNYQLLPITSWKFILTNILTTVGVFLVNIVAIAGTIFMIFMATGMQSRISFDWNWTEVLGLFSSDMVYPIALATAIAFVDLIFRTYERFARFTSIRVLVVFALGGLFVVIINLLNDYIDNLNIMGGHLMNYVILPIVTLAMFVANIWLFNRFVESKK